MTGILSPRMVSDATDVKVSSKGIDLTPLSPYCGKYAGYRVVWRAIGNVLLKAVISPFSLIAKAFGGGGDQKLDVIDF